MILLALAAATQAQWTGPRTIEYRGPGNFCGGGYAISLAAGDRALVLPQGQAPQATRLVIGGREVNIRTGVRPEPGTVVKQYGGTALTQTADGAGIAYIVSDQTAFALRLTSDSFHGFKGDRWFFSHANFADRADEGVDCLAGVSN
jgi:hypothetical protein